MKCIVLAAGYATRLYPLTENFPKPLLDVNGKSILDWLLYDLEAVDEIDEYIIISNHKFIGHFENWKSQSKLTKKITIIDDGSTANDNRLGAVKDIAFAINTCDIDDDAIVLAGDNVLDFSLVDFYKYFKEKNATCVMRYFEGNEDKLKRTGVATVDNSGLITKMVEKPSVPESNWAIPPFYIYSKSDLSKVLLGIEDENCDTDAPGSFIAWLCEKCQVYAYEMPGKRYDIGNLQSYEDVKREYKGIE